MNNSLQKEMETDLKNRSEKVKLLENNLIKDVNSGISTITVLLCQLCSATSWCIR